MARPWQARRLPCLRTALPGARSQNPATAAGSDGTAPASGTARTPSTCRKRSRDRNAVTIRFADLLRRTRGYVTISIRLITDGEWNLLEVKTWPAQPARLLDDCDFGLLTPPPTCRFS